MSSNSRQFFTPTDLAMLDRVLGHANYPQSANPREREARLEATRFLIKIFQSGVTSEAGLRSSLADRSVIEAPPIESMGYDIAGKIFSERIDPASAPKYPGGGYQYGKRVEINGTWTVYHVFTGVPAQFGPWEMVELNAKTALRALRILNTPEP